MRGFCGSVPPHTGAEGGISTAGEFSLNPVTTKLGPEWDDTASQKPQNQKKQCQGAHSRLIWNKWRLTKCRDNSKANVPSAFPPVMRSSGQLPPDLCLRPTKPISQRRWRFCCPPARWHTVYHFRKAAVLKSKFVFLCIFPNTTTQFKFPFFHS